MLQDGEFALDSLTDPYEPHVSLQGVLLSRSIGYSAPHTAHAGRSHFYPDCPRSRTVLDPTPKIRPRPRSIRRICCWLLWLGAVYITPC